MLIRSPSHGLHFSLVTDHRGGVQGDLRKFRKSLAEDQSLGSLCLTDRNVGSQAKEKDLGFAADRLMEGAPSPQLSCSSLGFSSLF